MAIGCDVAFPWIKTARRSIRQSDPRQGAFVRGKPHALQMTTHEVVWQNVPQSFFDTILSEYRTTKGGATTTTFTPPGGSPVTVFFGEEPFRANRKGMLWNIGPQRLIEAPAA